MLGHFIFLYNLSFCLKVYVLFIIYEKFYSDILFNFCAFCFLYVLEYSWEVCVLENISRPGFDTRMFSLALLFPPGVLLASSYSYFGQLINFPGFSFLQDFKLGLLSACCGLLALQFASLPCSFCFGVGFGCCVPLSYGGAFCQH